MEKRRTRWPWETRVKLVAIYEELRQRIEHIARRHRDCEGRDPAVTLTGRQLLDFVNAHGENELGICECGHWWEEHHDGTCDACLENAFDQDDPHAVADHAFVYSDEATAESEYLNEKARELGFSFEPTENTGSQEIFPLGDRYCDPAADP